MEGRTLADYNVTSLSILLVEVHPPPSSNRKRLVLFYGFGSTWSMEYLTLETTTTFEQVRALLPFGPNITMRLRRCGKPLLNDADIRALRTGDDVDYYVTEVTTPQKRKAEAIVVEDDDDESAKRQRVAPAAAACSSPAPASAPCAECNKMCAPADHRRAPCTHRMPHEHSLHACRSGPVSGG